MHNATLPRTFLRSTRVASNEERRFPRNIVKLRHHNFRSYRARRHSRGFCSESIAWITSSRVNYVNFVSGRATHPRPPRFPSLFVSYSFPPFSLPLNNRPLDDFVAPQITNIVRTSANPNQRRRCRRCSVDVASRVSPSLSMHPSMAILVQYSCLERAHFLDLPLSLFLSRSLASCSPFPPVPSLIFQSSLHSTANR